MRIPDPNSSTSSAIPTVWKWILSGALILHFLTLWTVYAANWRRSSTQDRWLNTFQPYLLGLGFGSEMVPVEWGRAPTADLPTRLILQYEDKALIYLDSKTMTWDRLKHRQLLGILSSTIEAGDDESVTQILASAVAHAEKIQGNGFELVRVEKISDPEVGYEEIYRASIVHEDNAPLRFVPALDPQRTIRRVVENGGSQP